MTRRRLGFTNRLAVVLVVLLALGLAGGFVLAVMSIRHGYTGPLACYTVVFTPIGTGLTIVLNSTVRKSTIENSAGDGTGGVFAAAQAAGFTDSQPI